MNDLVNFAVEARGGLKRWGRVTTVTAAASITGETWKVKGKPDYLKNVIFAVESKREVVDAAFSRSIAWKTKPSWFIVAKHDRVIPPDLEETMAATIGARTTTLNTCHLVMLDLPSKAAVVIADATGGQ